MYNKPTMCCVSWAGCALVQNPGLSYVPAASGNNQYYTYAVFKSTAVNLKLKLILICQEIEIFRVCCSVTFEFNL